MLENEYIENLVDKFTNIINEANHAKELYVTLGQKYANFTLTSFDTPLSCIVIPYKVSAYSIVFFL